MIDLSQVPELPTRPVWRSVLKSMLPMTLLLGGGWGVTRWNSPFPFGASTPALALTGLDENGRPVDLDLLGGQTAAVVFSLLHEPHGCPTMLTASERVMLALPANQRQVVWDEAQLTDVKPGVWAVTL
ncbi:hypothetical protein [Deinococcus sp. QL22]|uniref:hypothetical protein n=1 Tax=Deinococcus sp. QL22 TaxID=2939437 RepID=UPI002016AF14|nr:hypothetical protein [Deinococcus sp. QL22]UQN08070.1 hypothetical protein M1R55_18445 [Deinococcus sp. QL22]